MAMKVERIDTWAAALEDKPGSLSAKLKALATAGVNLEFVIARRAPDRPGKGVVFVAPIQGAASARAARNAGFMKTNSLHSVRVRGADKRGRGVEIAEALAKSRLNLRGMSGAAIDKKFVAYIALDSRKDAAKALRVLRRL